MLRTLAALALSHALAAGGTLAAPNDSFECRNGRGDEVIATLDTQVVFVDIRGALVDEIAADFTEEPAGTYERVSIDTTAWDICRLVPAWLFFSCDFHRYAYSTFSRADGTSDFLRLEMDTTGAATKGKLIDYFDGDKHYVSLFLYRRDMAVQDARRIVPVTYRVEFTADECHYRNARANF